MIFAVPEYQAHGEKLPATHWAWTPMNRWVAVDKDLDPAPSTKVEGPEVREYPIDHLPPGGTLVFVDVSGLRTDWVRSEPLARFLNTVANLEQDGDVIGPCTRCGHNRDAPDDEVACDHQYPTFKRSEVSAWEVLTGLIGDARSIRRAQLEALGKE